MDALGRAQLSIGDRIMGEVEEALDRGDIEAARQHFARARWLFEGVVEVNPNDDAARLELATTLERLAEAESDFGSLAAALEWYAKARVHWHRLAEASPYDPENFWGWIGGNLLAAAFIRGTGFDEAEPHPLCQ